MRASTGETRGLEPTRTSARGAIQADLPAPARSQRAVARAPLREGRVGRRLPPRPRLEHDLGRRALRWRPLVPVVVTAGGEGAGLGGATSAPAPRPGPLSARPPS